MDRDYWRSEPTKRLIEEARTKGCELCIALGERLEEADDALVVAEDEKENTAIDTDRTISELHLQIEGLLGKLVDAEDLIAELKETKK